MKDFRPVNRMLDEVMEDIHDIVDLKLIKAYNTGYEAGFNAKNYAETGHCTGCAYEFLAHYKEPCSECKNSHKNMYKAAR